MSQDASEAYRGSELQLRPWMSESYRGYDEVFLSLIISSYHLTHLSASSFVADQWGVSDLPVEPFPSGLLPFGGCSFFVRM